MFLAASERVGEISDASPKESECRAVHTVVGRHDQLTASATSAATTDARRLDVR
jgi:hypothetical protein